LIAVCSYSFRQNPAARRQQRSDFNLFRRGKSLKHRIGWNLTLLCECKDETVHLLGSFGIAQQR